MSLSEEKTDLKTGEERSVRDWSEASKSQGTKIAGNHQQLGEMHRRESPSEPPKGT